MFWIVLAFFINFVPTYSLNIGEGFDFNPLATDSSSSCDDRIARAMVRVEVGQNTSSYGGIGICNSAITNTFVGKDSNNRLNSSGTGFLVSLNPPILLTNTHVLTEALDRSILTDTARNRQNPCLSGDLNFNFTSLSESVGCKRVAYAFSPEMGVDAVFIELDRAPEGAMFLPLEQNFQPENNQSPESDIRFAGHPFGSDQLSLINCRITQNGSHNCDSTSGSSGSALLNSDCRVQGLH